MTFQKSGMCDRCSHPVNKHGTFGCLATVEVDGRTRVCSCHCPHRCEATP